ncbi:cysteine-rich KTR domain-containing protein [Gemmiger sp.]|uniref:cysteine-rich KTR domain-containing protein n=1 Tax=Gemmiger sp. TaxID=2049027 RepID=UPI00338D7FC6
MTIRQIDSHFLRCPNCGKESTIEVCKNTVLLNFPFACPHCQIHVFINYVEATAVVIDKKVILR